MEDDLNCRENGRQSLLLLARTSRPNLPTCALVQMSPTVIINHCDTLPLDQRASTFYVEMFYHVIHPGWVTKNYANYKEYIIAHHIRSILC